MAELVVKNPQVRFLGQEGGGHGNPPQYSCLENPMDRGASWATQSTGSQRVRQDRSNYACTDYTIDQEGNLCRQLILINYVLN